MLHLTGANMNTTSMTAQLNVRMDKALKEAGDAALSSIGLSPSDAVRALWHKAALRGESLETLGAWLKGESSEASEGKGLEWEDPFEEGRNLVLSKLEQMGVTDFTTPVSASDDELYEMAMTERMAERGLI